MFTEKEYKDLLDFILHNGIKRYSSKSVVPINFKENNDKKGKIFGFSTKKNLMDGTGVVYHSLEHLLSNGERLSHWTPNVYSWGGYNDYGSTFGHYEQNLNQINTFVVDLDYKIPEEKISVAEMMCNLIDCDLLPTMILATPKGYHLYFVINNENPETGKFDKASYISSQNNYKSLKIAKRISENIRKKLHSIMPSVDLSCNDFGVFRFPTRKNIIHFQPEFTKSFSGYLEWSVNYEKEEGIKTRKNIKLLPDQKKSRQVDTAWFELLINTKNISSGYGYGRNNAVYTLSLACKQSDVDLSECLDLLDQFNSNLDSPLPHRHVQRCVRSAYGGSKSGARKDFVNGLIETFVPETNVRFQFDGTNRNGWYKFKKAREDRKYSHYSEHKEDVILYLESAESEEGFIQMTMPQIAKETETPLSTLKIILKEMKEEGIIYLTSTRGRNGSTRLALVKQVQRQLMQKYIINKLTTTPMIMITNSSSDEAVQEYLNVYNGSSKFVPYNNEQIHHQPEKSG